MQQSQGIPDSMALVALMGFIFGGWMVIRHIGHVERNVHRRMLQNFVYRLYEYLRWISAVVRGVDAALDTYYTVMEKTKIAPVNERKFAPIRMEETNKQLAGPVPVAVVSRWNWRKMRRTEEEREAASA